MGEIHPPHNTANVTLLNSIFRSQRGQGLIEFAVIFPFFVIMLMMVIDGGLVMGHSSNAQAGAKEAARLGAVGESKANIVQRVVDASFGIEAGVSTDCSSTQTHVCVQWVPGPSGEPAGTVGSSVRVRILYRYKLLSNFAFPFATLGGHWNVTACALQRMERAAAGIPAADKSTGTC